MTESTWMCLEVLPSFNSLVNAVTAPSLLSLDMELAWIPCLRAERHFGGKCRFLPYTHLYLKQHKKVWSYFFALPGPQQIRKSLGLEEIGSLLLHKLKNKSPEKLF